MSFLIRIGESKEGNMGSDNDKLLCDYCGNRVELDNYDKERGVCLGCVNQHDWLKSLALAEELLKPEDLLPE